METNTHKKKSQIKKKKNQNQITINQLMLFKDTFSVIGGGGHLTGNGSFGASILIRR